MVTRNDVKDLELALHRKLINISSDIRKQRKLKYPDKVILELLKNKRKCVDATLSATKQLYIHFESQAEPNPLYTNYNRLYRSL